MEPSFDILTLLPDLLSGAVQSGDFCGSGAVDVPVVSIRIDGLGRLGLPIPPIQAEAIAKLATPAPYGLGKQTLVDPTVRRCGQISASMIHSADPRWHRVVEQVTRQAAASLGAEGEVRAELYKLLVYQPGDFFTQHRDTEKEPSMFATLVIVLPCPHSGGELVVRHAGREATLDLANGSLEDEDEASRALGVVRWAAFYAGCQHELRPLRAGYRVALVYNLLRPNGRAMGVPDHRPTISSAAQALRDWEQQGDEGPLKLVYPLKHQYSLAELAFTTLKNEDAAAADVLIAAAEQANCVLRLAMVSMQESGTAQPIWEGRRSRRWRRYGDEDDGADFDAYEVVDICDSSQTLDNWLRRDDSNEPLGPIPYADDEVSPPDALADLEPDQDHCHEATGNEGASFERTYRQAAFVMWPASHELEVLSEGGPEASLAMLERLLGESGGDKNTVAMAKMIVQNWRPPAGYDDQKGELRSRLIAALAQLEETKLLSSFLREVVTAGAFDGEESAALAAALLRFDGSVAGDLLIRLVQSSAKSHFAPVASALRYATQAREGSAYAEALAAAVEAMSTVGDQAVEWRNVGSAMKARPAVLMDLLKAIDWVREPTLAVALLAAVERSPKKWPMDAVVLPAVLQVQREGTAAYQCAETGLREAAVAHLRARIGLPLAPPPNATRSTTRFTCKCAECGRFRSFLAHPFDNIWMLKAAKQFREHIGVQVLAARCDVDMQTQTRGSPHTLICTKNQASYELRVKQRAADIEMVGRLV